MDIAFLASHVTLPGSPTRRSDAWEHDLECDAIRAGLAPHGARLHAVSWDDRDTDWARFDAVVIGTTWDYWDREQEFLDTLDGIENQTRLFNSARMVRWNARKTYLKDLEARGAKLIPTLWPDAPTAEDIHTAFDTLGSDDLVIKRQVGAGAKDQVRLRRGDTIPTFTRPMMVQPFQPAIQTEGEYSFLFFGGDFSHALVKNAAHGDYRIQSMYGGRETAITPSDADAEAAHAIISALDETPLYGRVDMVRGPGGGLLLMELELIEPYLYPEQGPNMGRAFAHALMERL